MTVWFDFPAPPRDTQHFQRTARELSSRIGELSELSRELRSERHPEKYLEGVYMTAWSLSKNRPEGVVEQALDVAPPQDAQIDWYIERLLKRTSGADRQLRSKYSITLRLAALRSTPPSGFARFYGDVGGVKGAATTWARIRKGGGRPDG